MIKIDAFKAGVITKQVDYKYFKPILVNPPTSRKSFRLVCPNQ
ncbi:MAG TPA: hypothetical protein PLN13_06290 [Bacteroidia bacterium]|nr:hypothetical protein [Bacteroidia bacterium]HRH08173.1 hypothetical protein [Bacteroidia bacterium]